MKNRHILLKTNNGRYELHCAICKTVAVPGLPIAVEEFSKLANEFISQHAHDGHVPSCKWVYDPGSYEYPADYWGSDCGLTWQLEVGTPPEHQMNYCPKCGRVLVVAEELQP